MILCMPDPVKALVFYGVTFCYFSSSCQKLLIIFCWCCRTKANTQLPLFCRPFSWCYDTLHKNITQFTILQQILESFLKMFHLFSIITFQALTRILSNTRNIDRFLTISARDTDTLVAYVSRLSRIWFDTSKYCNISTSFYGGTSAFTSQSYVVPSVNAIVQQYII